METKATIAEHPETEEQQCQHGYRCTFNEATKNYFKCSSCDRVSREVSLTSCCQKQYCGPHLQQIHNSKKGCPNCGEDFTIIPNKTLREGIMALSVFCTMKQQGCDWEGVVRDLHTHEDTCEFVYVPCPKRCDLLQIKRGELPKHLTSDCPEREYSCPHCNFKDTYRHVMNAHLPDCSYYPVKCPNKCGVVGERDDMDKHLLEECPLHYIPCKFSHAGCTEKFRREKEDEHMDQHSQQHLNLLATATRKLGDEVTRNAELGNQNEKLRGDVQELKTNREKMKEEMESLVESQQIQREELRNQLALERGRVDVLEKQVSNVTNHMGYDISPPEHHGESERSRELERRIEDKDKELQELRKSLQEQKINADQQNMMLEKRLAKLEKLLNNSAMASASQIPPPPATNGDSPLPTFTLEGFTDLKKKEEQWKSPTFGVYEGGPPLQLIVWPNGQREGKDTHVSVWLAHGQEDSENENCFEPFKVTITLELMDQCNTFNLDPIHVVVTKDFNVQYKQLYMYIIGDFSNQFVAHSKLIPPDPTQQTQYFVNDSLKFRITCIHIQKFQEITEF